MAVDLAAQTGTDSYALIASYLGVTYATVVVLLTVLSIWALVWKGIALWKSGRRSQPIWFIILLITNTFGLLSIIYLLIYRGRKPTLSKPKPVARSVKKKK